jgi:class 3 adenylate cyclase
MTNDVLSRRLAVIVAADVVGYSRLMEADEAGTLAQLKSIRKELIDPKIAEHRGRLVKTTGDGLLMEFSSVTDGVQGAIEIQEALAERNSAVPTDRAPGGGRRSRQAGDASKPDPLRLVPRRARPRLPADAALRRGGRRL